MKKLHSEFRFLAKYELTIEKLKLLKSSVNNQIDFMSKVAEQSEVLKSIEHSQK